MTTDRVSTAEIFPGQYLISRRFTISRGAVIALLSLIVLAGFLLRSTQLDVESLGEDEWKKLQTVEEYRTNGLTGANGEHPFLLKGILTLGVSAADHWNRSEFAAGSASRQIPVETALRLPVTIVGALIAVLIFLIAAELFGKDVGLIAAALWTFDPSGISFSRIAKEDTVMTFFFLLANWFFLRSQRAAENGEDNYLKWLWGAAVAYGAMIATKYFPHFMAISAAYYYTFQRLPETKWRFGKQKWFLFLLIVGASFLIFNPTILLPDTWKAMVSFLSENRVGYKVESSYEYFGTIYRNKLTLWLLGVPWSFYYLFILVKMPVVTLLGLAGGLVLIFQKRLGDGRYFVFWYCFFWFVPFSILGGKFTRYFVFAEPAVLLIAALGISWFARKFSDRLASVPQFGIENRNRIYAVTFLLISMAPLVSALQAAPHYRLYTNSLGRTIEATGNFFPHDEFFDAALGETAKSIAGIAANGARVYSETPKLTEFHLRREGRSDLTSAWLSDPEELSLMRSGDIIIDARGRRYLSNADLLGKLEEADEPAGMVKLGDVPAVRIYKVDDAYLSVLQAR